MEHPPTLNSKKASEHSAHVRTVKNINTMIKAVNLLRETT